jgi:hypothetical protein
MDRCNFNRYISQFLPGWHFPKVELTFRLVRRPLPGEKVSSLLSSNPPTGTLAGFVPKTTRMTGGITSMTRRLLFLGILFAAFAMGAPITYTFSGTGLSGTVGAATFTDVPFIFTFTSDTTLLVVPPSIPVDLSTPEGTPATFNINSGQFIGTFMDDQAVFTHPAPEQNIGIWHFDCCDWLTKGDPAFAAYNMASNVSVSTGINSVIPNSFFLTSSGFIGLTSGPATMTFTAVVSESASGVVPEPSTMTLICLGVAGLLIGAARRNRRGV